MTDAERKILFASLGFVTALIKSEDKGAVLARKAEAIGGLVEEFCKDRCPEAFPLQEEPTQVIWLADQIVGAIKTQMRTGQPVELPEDRELKLELLRTLQDRQCLYVMDAQQGDELIDAAILNLLKAELQNVKSEAQMRIAHVQGDPNAFAPYQYLATAIAKIIREKGSCSKADVRMQGGFSEEELKSWNMAYALAQVDLMGG